MVLSGGRLCHRYVGVCLVSSFHLPPPRMLRRVLKAQGPSLCLVSSRLVQPRTQCTRTSFGVGWPRLERSRVNRAASEWHHRFDTRMPVDERKAIIHAHLRRTRAAADQRVKISHLPSHFGPRYVVAIVFHITLASAPNSACLVRGVGERRGGTDNCPPPLTHTLSHWQQGPMSEPRRGGDQCRIWPIDSHAF